MLRGFVALWIMLQASSEHPHSVRGRLRSALRDFDHRSFAAGGLSEVQTIDCGRVLSLSRYAEFEGIELGRLVLTSYVVAPVIVVTWSA